MLRIVPRMEVTDFDVFRECFKNPKYLEAAISCSNDCAALMSELESVSPGHNCVPAAEDLNQETASLEKITVTANNLLEEIQLAITGVQSTKLNAQERKETNLQTTKEAFSLLRKALDDREHKLLQKINAGAERKENALNAQQQKLTYLGAQVRNHLYLVNQTAVSKLGADRLNNSTVLLEHRMKDLITMKNGTAIEPVRREQALVNISGVQQLCQDVSKLGNLCFNGSVEHVWEHTVPADRRASLTITVRDVGDDCVSVKVEELEAKILSPTGKEIPAVITDIGSGQYTVSFVPEVAGEHDIAVLVAGEPVPQSPYRLVNINHV